MATAFYCKCLLMPTSATFAHIYVEEQLGGQGG